MGREGDVGGRIRKGREEGRGIVEGMERRGKGWEGDVGREEGGVGRLEKEKEGDWLN